MKIKRLRRVLGYGCHLGLKLLVSKRTYNCSLTKEGYTKRRSRLTHCNHVLINKYRRTGPQRWTDQTTTGTVLKMYFRSTAIRLW